MKKLSGKNAFITGATGVLGKAIVFALAQEDAHVTIGYRTGGAVASGLATEMQALGYTTDSLQIDVADRTSVNMAVEAYGAKHNALHILVNCAGINRPEDFDKISEQDWDDVLAVNLKGPFLCMQSFLPLLKKANGASVINLGSISGQFGGPRTAHYAASKAGLISLGQVFARFAAKDGIRVNTLAAGYVESSMANSSQGNPAVQSALEGILLKRKARPEEIASVVSFLASDDASYITAQTIGVNGGGYF